MDEKTAKNTCIAAAGAFAPWRRICGVSALAMLVAGGWPAPLAAADHAPAIASPESGFDPHRPPPGRDSLSTRLTAVLAMGQVRRLPDTALAGLAALLDDPAPNLREAAADALAGQGARAVPALVRILTSDSPVETRLLAMRALGAMGADAKSAVTALASHGRAGSARLRAAAIRALGRIGGDRSWPENLPWDSELRAFAGGISRPLTAAVRAQYAPDLNRLLVGRIHPLLIEALTDAEPPVRRAAVKALGNLAGHKAESRRALADASRDLDSQVRFAAIHALAAAAPVHPETVAAFARALEDPDRAVRRAAARHLGKAGAIGLPALLAAARAPRIMVRLAAIEALVDYAPPTEPRVRAVILQARNDQAAPVREAAAASPLP